MRVKSNALKATLLLGVLLVVMGTIAGANPAELQSASSVVDRQSSAWTEAALTVTSGEWTNLPGLRSSVGPLAGGTLSATISLVVEGQAPVELRIRNADGPGPCVSQDCSGEAMHPGAASFRLGDPLGGSASDSVSFTFVDASTRCDYSTLDVQAKSPSGDPVEILSGSVNVLWRAPRKTCL